MYGGEMTADNSPNIVLDMEGCYPGTGCSAGQVCDALPLRYWLCTPELQLAVQGYSGVF